MSDSHYRQGPEELFDEDTFDTVTALALTTLVCAEQTSPDLQPAMISIADEFIRSLPHPAGGGLWLDDPLLVIASAARLTHEYIDRFIWEKLPVSRDPRSAAYLLEHTYLRFLEISDDADDSLERALVDVALRSGHDQALAALCQFLLEFDSPHRDRDDGRRAAFIFHRLLPVGLEWSLLDAIARRDLTFAHQLLMVFVHCEDSEYPVVGKVRWPVVRACLEPPLGGHVMAAASNLVAEGCSDATARSRRLSLDLLRRDLREGSFNLSAWLVRGHGDTTVAPALAALLVTSGVALAPSGNVYGVLVGD